ncbi:VCBS repeat-containing protein [Sulfitobacter sp. F26204]|uniref:FG-GAP repeat domain-containing protein n=1 Tax=Sulfitobacter sp. F26204 TaxID=2996014 RepID=UPI00225E4F90|nr:VCBS repeat-containing protein [Sulfitobacter sp. F26204]MCX7559289.1 VCBS repeat-containing protein [Sulfitobacter sp. F26204]
MRWLVAWLMWWSAGPLFAQTITEAAYNEPTQRYAHGVLGDNVEWGNLSVTVHRETGSKDGLLRTWRDQTYHLRQPEDRVFEDTAPRLVDLDGDDKPEIIVVESHSDYGARLAVYGLNVDGIPELQAWTRFIGRKHRWVAPVGAADFNGDGVMEIAFVDRPHLVQKLRVFSYAKGEAGAFEELDALTNHRIGDDYISGGIRKCADKPEMVLLSPDWRDLVLVHWQEDGFVKQRIGANNGPESIAAALACS